MTESDVPSQKTQAKAAEYLLAGRVKVRDCRELIGAQKHTFVADVSSSSQDGEPYHVKFGANGWHCDCPARVPVFAHILACQTITDFTPPTTPPTFGANPNESVEDFLKGLD